MNVRVWKAGLIVALVTGLLTGLGAYSIADHVNWGKFGLFLLACVAKDGLLYLKSHPIEDAFKNQISRANVARAQKPQPL